MLKNICIVRLRLKKKQYICVVMFMNYSMENLFYYDFK